ncbi:integron integrase [Adhaeribacter radiodurans]|uniref:Integron integrase n=1 Tax=Adhaeribacter radiodurans TaxID=2745197 RepID=A0A7L7LA84_9BACT|nr:integron integrase [Adhaeribacter radiodurans]QMU29746.1 integron integrase [Adhaeribacter radiodurans]
METASQLLDQARKTMQSQQLSNRTEAAYCDWIFRYFLFNGKKDPLILGEKEVATFLDYLSLQSKKSASTQNQAHCALLFLYNEVLHQPLAKLHFSRLKHYRSIPAILTKKEIDVLYSYLDRVPRLVAGLLYGCGLKITEGLSLRVRDVDVEKKQLKLNNRVLFFPASLEPELQFQIQEVAAIHQEDIKLGFGEVDIPLTVRAQNPAEAKTLAWQYLFPAARCSVHRSANTGIRFHLHESILQKAIKQAVEKAQLNKSACCYSLRHSYAAHLLESGNDIGTIQKLLGLQNKRSTMIYTYLVKQQAQTGKKQIKNHLSKEEDFNFALL